MISRDFKVALKLADKPAWKIAQSAEVDPSTLSKIITGMISVRPGDERVLRVAKVLGLSPDECFEVPKVEE
jgi:hypothetical protein